MSLMPFREPSRPLADIATLRGISEPFMFAADRKSMPGHMILHCVRVETVVVPHGACLTLKGLHGDSDPRLDFLCEAFGGPELAREVKGLLQLLGQADPTGQSGEKRHEEWPIKIIAAADAAKDLCSRLDLVTKLVDNLK